MTFNPTTFVDERLGKVLTQYRESSNLLALIRNYLEPTVEFGNTLCAISDAWDIDTATGHQLTIIGNSLGWPRVHCEGLNLQVFGFQPGFNLGGFGAVWDFPGDQKFGKFTFTDDDLYRAFLKSLVIKLNGEHGQGAVREAAQILFGPDTDILYDRVGEISIYAERVLTATEISILHLYEQIMPVAPGVKLGIYQATNGQPFGFGAGWGEFGTSDFPTPAI